jgi:hypothetical protein
MSLALGLGLGPSYGGGVAFSPLALFAAGEAGFWYDPGTISTLFQDAAGTTAVAAAADPTGLALDRSKGLILGSELVTNGDFSNGTTGWSVTGSGSGSVASGQYTLNGTTTSYASQSFATVVGASYSFTCTIVSQNGAAFNGIRKADTANASSNAVSLREGIVNGPGTTSGVFIATATTTYIVIQANTGAVITADDISVKLLPGNHAALSGANTLRPLYQVSPARLVFDATDDRLLTTLNPTTSGTIAARIKGGAASKVALGSQGASNGRAFLALAADGSLGAGIGADSTSTIKGSADIRAAWATGVVTWDGSTVKLYQDGAQVYSGAQNGAVNTTVPWMFGCLNNNATAASFWDGSIGAAIVLDRSMTASEVLSLTSYWSTIA